MDSAVYIVSSPLHLFVALGLMCGPLRHHRHAVALINQRPQQRDFLAEALEADAGRRASVDRFPVVSHFALPARQVLGDISAFTARQAPTLLAAGNDAKKEFYAAVRGCPEARRVFLEDGLYSYLPVRDSKPPWRQRYRDWRRGLKYGVPVERAACLGGSRAIQESYVLMPERVHAALARKPVHRLEREWFADPWLRGVCIAAGEAAGFDAQRCRSIGLLLLPPQLELLQQSAPLRRRFEAVARAHGERGELVAIKRHPRARDIDSGLGLDLPPEQLIEIPPRLPSEALVPLLSPGTLVVGALTTALLTLALLAEHVTVRSAMSMEPGRGAAARFNNGALRLYEAVGIRPLEDDAAP